jgi:hypothetical protein
MVSSVEAKFKVIQEIANGKKKGDDVCRKFGLVNSTIQMVRKLRTNIVSAFGRNGRRIKRFRKPERSDIDEVLINCFKQRGSDNIPVSLPLLVINFVLPNFKFNLTL